MMFIELHIASHGFTNHFVKLTGQAQQVTQADFKRASQASQQGQAATVFFFQSSKF